jgi:hypothetical protein
LSKPTTIGIIAAAFVNLGDVRHVMAQTKGSNWASAEAGACSSVEPPALSVRRRTRLRPEFDLAQNAEIVFR